MAWDSMAWDPMVWDPIAWNPMAWDPMAGEPMVEQARNHIPPGHQKPLEKHIKNVVNHDFSSKSWSDHFARHDPNYYTTSDWFAPGKIKQCHTGRPLCLGNSIQGDHCVPIPWSKILYYIRLACPRKEKHTGRPLCLGNAIQGDHCVPTGDHGRPCKKQFKTIGFTVYFAFLTQKSDFQLGRTVKKVTNHYKTIGFTDKVVQKRPIYQFGPAQCTHWP